MFMAAAFAGVEASTQAHAALNKLELPAYRANNQDQAESPLVFMRTPGGAVQENTCPDSTKR